MKKFLAILIATVCLTGARADAVKVADITRLGGQRSNVLTGLGLVYGLKGTGDGGDFLPAIKPLASMLGKFSDPATVAEKRLGKSRSSPDQGDDHANTPRGSWARATLMMNA